MLNKKYRIIRDGEDNWKLQKRKLLFWYEDVMADRKVIDGIEFVNPFCTGELADKESMIVRYFKLMNFDPSNPEPNYVDIMDPDDPEREDYEKGGVWNPYENDEPWSTEEDFIKMDGLGLGLIGGGKDKW